MGKFTSSGTKYGNVPSRAAMAGSSLGSALGSGIEKGLEASRKAKELQAQHDKAMELADRKAALDYLNSQNLQAQKYKQEVDSRDYETYKSSLISGINNKTINFDPTKVNPNERDITADVLAGRTPSPWTTQDTMGAGLSPVTEGTSLEDKYKSSQTDLNVAKTESEVYKNSPEGRRESKYWEFVKDPYRSIQAKRRADESGGKMTPSQIIQQDFEDAYNAEINSGLTIEQQQVSKIALDFARKVLKEYNVGEQVSRDDKKIMMEAIRSHYPNKEKYPTELIAQAVEEAIATKNQPQSTVDYFQ